MSAKRFYHVLAALLGYALIIGGFVVFGSALDSDVRLLDVVVACVVFTQAVLMSAFPIIDVRRRAHREVGMMGAHYVAVSLYSLVAIGVIVAGAAIPLSFACQLMAQGGALFLLIVARVAVLHAGDTVERVAGREEAMSAAKDSVMSRIDSLALAAMRARGVDPAILARVEGVKDDVRFLSPSLKPEARQADASIIALADEAAALLKSAELNRERIAETMTEIEMLVSQRKKY